jgi:hypothetical protein
VVVPDDERQIIGWAELRPKPAGEIWYGISVPMKPPVFMGVPVVFMGFNVVDGEIRLTEIGAAAWLLNKEKDDRTTIQVLFEGEWNRWYLTYDPEGKKEGVFLSKTKGAGTQWTLTKLEDSADKMAHLLQAAEGKMGGRFLAISPDEKRLILSDTPPVKHFRVYTLTR